MIPSGTRFIGISPTVDLTERRSALLNKQTEPFTVDDIRGYKVYTALLTQVGGAGNAFIGPGELTIGVTYMINDSFSGQDFTNVGAPNNNVGTWFVATGTTPNNWGLNQENGLIYYPGAPVANVLENTIGNIWFTYEGVGVYYFNSDSLFTSTKSWGISDSVYNGYDERIEPVFIDVNGTGPNQVYITTQDNLLSSTPIEIRVYN